MRFVRIQIVAAIVGLLLFAPSTSAQTNVLYNYYFAHVASGGIWRTTLTYVNPGSDFVTCNTSFYSNTGAHLPLTFAGITTSLLTQNVLAGGTIHTQTDAQPTAPVQTGWALCQCTGPIKASILFRSYSGALPQAEGSVLGATTPGESIYYIFGPDYRHCLCQSSHDSRHCDIYSTQFERPATCSHQDSLPAGDESRLVQYGSIPGYWDVSGVAGDHVVNSDHQLGPELRSQSGVFQSSPRSRRFAV